LKIRNLEGKSTLAPHPEQSLIVQEIFKKMSSGAYSAEELRKKYLKELKGMSKNNFLLLLRRIVFTGQIEIHESDDEPRRVVNGIHPPIISIEVFKVVQDILDGKRIKLRTNNQNIEQYPLKAFLHCNDHNRSFTASGSTSRTKKIHHYYHCNISTCKHRFPAKKIDEMFISFLSQLEFPDEILRLYQEILNDALTERRDSRKTDTNSNKVKLEKLTTKLQFLKDQYLDQKIDPETFNELKSEVQNQIQELKMMEEDFKSEFIPFKSLFDKSLRILPDLVNYFMDADGQTKQKLVGSIFSGKIEFSKNEVRTVSYKDFIAQIFLISNNIQGYKMKKADKNVSLINVAPPINDSCNQSRLPAILKEIQNQSLNPII
jgi:hypothetical protein